MSSLEFFADVAGVCFPGEENMVLFIPGSGDVLRTSVTQWNSLLYPQKGVFSELKTTLLSLGALHL
jgi:hypothetical protein